MSTSLRDAPASTNSPSQRIRTTMAAARVSLSWFGVRKSLSREQQAQAADAFGAEGDYVSAAKKRIDTRHPAYKTVTSVRSRIVAYWKGNSLAYPEPGVRLIRREDVTAFDDQLTQLQADLAEAVTALDAQYAELRSAARERLGRLYSAADYPESLEPLFAVHWDFPSFEPPAYLRQLAPELYRHESERIQHRFAEAVRLAEDAFTSELAKLVSHLTERLAGGDDGQPKVFRDSALEHLHAFF